ncbi:MAG: type VI secretion system needle protein Hcp [Paludibacteraceae bacterium]|nr:type VI secretion system needle protein Hcp [Paludibacteraceae bacterium]
MFGYKSILQLTGGNSSLAAVVNSRVTSEFELSDFSYDILQDTDLLGKPQGDVRAGRMNFSFPNLPTTEMLEWMINSRKYKSGGVVVYDMEDTPLQKVTFSCAACVGMDINYSESGSNYCLTKLTIVAKEIFVGDVKMENEWKNI